jgi:hypothetical protein
LRAYGGRLHLVDTESGLLAMDDTCCEEAKSTGMPIEWLSQPLT